MEEKKDANNEDEIVIEIENKEEPHTPGRRRSARIDKTKKGKKNKKDNKTAGKNDGKKEKKKMSKKKKLIIVLSIIGVIILALGIVFGTYIFKSGGNVKDAVLNMATDIVGKQDPIFVLLLGVSDDISAKLTDTIILCGYNPNSQKAIMLSVPRDTFVGKSEATANGYDKINAQFQTSAEKTMEKVQLITGITIDYYAIVRNISLTSIFEVVGSVEFDVPINMDYDDPTQNLHIHLKKGLQTLQPNQIEQLLRFRHNNNGTSYPSSYGDNDYGRMRTQREFIKAVVQQKLSLQNLSGLKDMVSYVYSNLQTNMEGNRFLDYAPYALKFNPSNIRTEQLPGQSALINELWFYKTNFPKTRRLADELMVYLEIDDAEYLKSHYKYADDIIGVKPDGNWTPENIVIDDDWEPTVPNKNTNTTDDNTVECTHSYGVVENTATCEFAGTTLYKCVNCGHEYTEPSKALGHVFENGACTRPGCKEKDSNYKKDTSSKNETNTNTNTNTTVNNGTTDNNTTTNNTQTHEHKYSKETITKQATCKETGIKTLECSCGDKKTDVIPVTGNHNFAGGATCTVCGATNPNYNAPETEKPDPGKEDPPKEDENNNSGNDGNEQGSGVTTNTDAGAGA